MNNQYKAKKTPRNQSANFDETLAPTWVNPAYPQSAVPAPAVTRLRNLRLALGVVWLVAAIAAGVGVGLMIKEAAAPVGFAEPPAPVATAELAVSSAASANTATIGPAAPQPTQILTVQPSQNITQAQAGSVFSTISVGGTQPTLSPNALQPGFVHFGHSQGNIGTSPVR